MNYRISRLINRAVFRCVAVGIVAGVLLQGCAWMSPMRIWQPDPFSIGAEHAIPLDATRETLRRIQSSPDLDALVKSIFDRTLAEVDANQLHTDMISISLLDLADPAQPRLGAWQGDTPWYPASIIKVPFMVYAMHLIQLGALEYDAPLREEMIKMIGPSSNIACQYVVDRITFTTGGDSLSGEAWDEWRRARYTPFMYFTSLDLDEIFALQKTWDRLPPAPNRDRDLLGRSTDYHFEFSNKMTTNDTARLFYLIDQRAIVSPGACDHMLDLMRREPRPLDVESGRYFVMRHGIPEDARIWSKDGSTSLQWHDAAIIDLADGRKFILVIFTHFKDKTTAFIPLYTRRLIEELN